MNTVIRYKGVPVYETDDYLPVFICEVLAKAGCEIMVDGKLFEEEENV